MLLLALSLTGCIGLSEDEDFEELPDGTTAITFASEYTRPADLHRVETPNANLHSYVLPRQYRIHRVVGTVEISSGYSSSMGFTLAMAYTHTQSLGMSCVDISIQSGQPVDFDVTIDQDQLEARIVGGVFQTYFGYGYTCYGTIYVTEDCRYWDDDCRESTS